MALRRLLIPLLCMVTSELSHIQTRPIDFVCDSQARRLMNKVQELEVDMTDCNAATTLPISVRLPCIKVHKASWERKSVQEKRSEILLSLGSLAQDVQFARTLSQPGCGRALLDRFEHSANNYVHILTHLAIEGELETQPNVCVGQDSVDLRLVLSHFGRLLSGKLESLISQLAQKCQRETLTFDP